jgi:hypothetical protein
MTTTSQHNAVVNATKTWFGERFQAGQDVKTYATKADKQAIALAVAEGMLSGEVELSDAAKAKYATSIESLVSKYVMGMVTNWFNKSKELNGGLKYEIKNPGSRAGTGDAQIKEMRLLRKQLLELGNADGVARVDAAIADRLAEIGTAATKTVEINAESIPEGLRDLVG